MQKNKLLFVAVIFGLLFCNITFVHAANSIQDSINAQDQAFAGQGGAKLGNPQDPRIIVANIIRVFLTFVGTLATAYLVYGGYLYMTSAGNETRSGNASKIMLFSTLGILIVLTSYSITLFIYKVYLSSIEPTVGLGQLLLSVFGSLFGSLF
ncbi:MAG: hypothetical protein COU28_03570 [Candidatus Magasanikbacteria bacterium CG10_big_fil_rev_8_21_14_0_10_36_16]|uniref:DUF5671 domain-containing protein n=1 Tax=Candidatus Magasanikbacteria bacterium CG10_big_fil_rev_8_21_14_0_10_36_16 TaxID=1974645 RepID=A0A2H0TXY6_9BACT|nr:MAG: hypothetical protein COU28_03570 [Candidatus Magasanikbacteria bacterium CG10_big_fil_rev_8_21_14_0_10_36_16]